MFRWLNVSCLSTYTFPITCAKEVGHKNVKACEKNVNLGLQLAACSTVLQTITQAQIFDAYLYLSSGQSNTIVGVGESIVGLTALFIMIPAASVVDKNDRGKICDAAAWFALTAATLSVFALWIDSIKVLFVSLVIWGFHWELCNSASDCIFVDSLPIMDRTNMISKKTVTQVVACSFAIGIQLCFFFLFGNTWSISMCKAILTVGYLGLTPIVMKHLFAMVDRRYIPVSPGVYSGGLTFNVNPKTAPITNVAAESYSETESTVEELSPGPIDPLLVEPLVKPKNSLSMNSIRDRDAALLGELQGLQSMIPYLVGASDFVRAVGAGMTVKFFSLFFMNEYYFSPVHVTLLGIIYNLCIALFTEQANNMAEVVGRSMTSLIYQIVSLILFFVLYRTYSLPWVILIYLIRGSAGNAFAALDRSIVADTTSVKHRGKWMAIESLSHVTWSGSAFIGGLLTDVYDYRTTFLYTAFVYALALLIYLPVAVLYPKSMDKMDDFDCDFSRFENQSFDCTGDNTIRETHEALYQSRLMRDSISLSRARGTSVAAPMAIESLLEREEFTDNKRRLTTCDVINNRRVSRQVY